MTTEQQYYDEVAKRERGVKAVMHTSFLMANWIDFMEKESIKNLLPKKNLEILDIGCGNGRFFKRFINNGYKITGVDFSKELISQAKKAFPDAELIVEDFNKFKTNKKFDMVFLGVSIPNFDKIRFQKFIYKSCSFLKENGILVIIDRADFPKNSWNENDLFSALRDFKLILNKHAHITIMRSKIVNHDFKAVKIRNKKIDNFLDMLIVILILPLEIIFRVFKINKFSIGNIYFISIRAWVFERNRS